MDFPKAEFGALGFSPARTFVASPQKWVVEFWLSSEPGLFARIIASKGCGVYSEVTVMNRAGLPPRLKILKNVN
jgi:hypothetical protein